MRILDIKRESLREFYRGHFCLKTPKLTLACVRVAGYENLFYLKCSSEKNRLNTNVKRENDICLCTHFR